MAACGNFDKMIACKLLCSQLAKVANNTSDKEFFKVYSAIGKLLNYEGLLDAVFSANIGKTNAFINSVKNDN